MLDVGGVRMIPKSNGVWIDNVLFSQAHLNGCKNGSSLIRDCQGYFICFDVSDETEASLKEAFGSAEQQNLGVLESQSQFPCYGATQPGHCSTQVADRQSAEEPDLEPQGLVGTWLRWLSKNVAEDWGFTMLLTLNPFASTDDLHTFQLISTSTLLLDDSYFEKEVILISFDSFDHWPLCFSTTGSWRITRSVMVFQPSLLETLGVRMSHVQFLHELFHPTVASLTSTWWDASLIRAPVGMMSGADAANLYLWCFWNLNGAV